MARPVQFSFPSSNTASVAGSQTLAASADVVLTGNLPYVSMGDDVETSVLFKSTADLSGITFTVYFSNLYGQRTTGTVTGPNNTSKETSFYANRIYRITASGAVNTAFSVGIGSGQESRWYTPSSYNDPFNIGIGASVTGSVTFSVQHTFSDVQATTSPVTFQHATMNATTTSQDGYYAFNMQATRAIVNSGSTGSLVVTFIQAGT